MENIQTLVEMGRVQHHHQTLDSLHMILPLRMSDKVVVRTIC